MLPVESADLMTSRTIIVSKLNGDSCTVEVQDSWKVSDLRNEVETLLGIPQAEQRLLNGTGELSCDTLLKVVGDTHLTVYRKALSEEQKFWIQQVKDSLSNFDRVPSEMRDDPDVVMAAISTYAIVLSYACDALREDRDFNLAAVKTNASAFLYVNPEFTADREIAFAAALNGCGSAATAFNDDVDFMLPIVEKSGESLKHASNNLRDSSDFVLAAVKQDPYALRFASARLKRDDETVVRCAVEQDPCVLMYAHRDWADIFEKEKAPSVIRERSHSLQAFLQKETEAVQVGVEDPSQSQAATEADRRRHSIACVVT